VLLRGATPLDLLPTAGVLASLSVVFGGFAIVVFRILEASARRSGMLGRY